MRITRGAVRPAKKAKKDLTPAERAARTRQRKQIAGACALLLLAVFVFGAEHMLHRQKIDAQLREVFGDDYGRRGGGPGGWRGGGGPPGAPGGGDFAAVPGGPVAPGAPGGGGGGGGRRGGGQGFNGGGGNQGGPDAAGGAPGAPGGPDGPGGPGGPGGRRGQGGWGGPGGRNFDPQQMAQRMMDRETQNLPNVTAQQKAQFAAIAQQTGAAMAAVMANNPQGGRPTEAQRQQMMAQRNAQMQQMIQTLTPEQKQAYGERSNGTFRTERGGRARPGH